MLFPRNAVSERSEATKWVTGARLSRYIRARRRARESQALRGKCPLLISFNTFLIVRVPSIASETNLLIETNCVKDHPGEFGWHGWLVTRGTRHVFQSTLFSINPKQFWNGSQCSANITINRLRSRSRRRNDLAAALFPKIGNQAIVGEIHGSRILPVMMHTLVNSIDHLLVAHFDR